MSAGDFITVTYEAAYAANTYHPIRVQAETALASVGGVSNAVVGQNTNNPIQAKVSGSKRTIGLVARRIRLKLASGATPPAGGYTANSRTVIPALTTAFYTAATKGETVVYLGANWEVTGRIAEVPE